MVRFYCRIDDKKKYYEVKRKINLQRGTLLRESIRDLKDEFFAELECLVHGRTLYLDIRNQVFVKISAFYLIRSDSFFQHGVTH